jgi:hypothetical protein
LLISGHHFLRFPKGAPQTVSIFVIFNSYLPNLFQLLFYFGFQKVPHKLFLSLSSLILTYPIYFSYYFTFFLVKIYLLYRGIHSDNSIRFILYISYIAPSFSPPHTVPILQSRFCYSYLS